MCSSGSNFGFGRGEDHSLDLVHQLVGTESILILLIHDSDDAPANQLNPRCEYLPGPFSYSAECSPHLGHGVDVAYRVVVVSCPVIDASCVVSSQP